MIETIDHGPQSYNQIERYQRI